MPDLFQGRRESCCSSRRSKRMWINDFCIVLCVICCLCASLSEGSVHVYNYEKFGSNGNAFIFNGGSEGLHASAEYAKSGKGANAGVDDGRSFIRFDNIRFHRKEASKSDDEMSVVHALIFEASDRDNIGGSAYGGQKAICCTPDLAKLEGCKQGEIILRPSAGRPNWPYVMNAQFSGVETEAMIETKNVPISKTGMYNLYFISCDPKLKGLVVSGKTIWKNPTGYLPGSMAPLMTFYGFMSLAYLLLGLVWFFQYARFWKEILQLQNCITLVITLGMFEMALWYFDYANFNMTGIRPTGITIWAVTFGSVKRTVSRLIILVVSMGYGVVRPTLGGLTSKVILLGATFFVASEVLDLVENVGSINDLSGKARLFIILPVAILDAFFIIWIFISLAKTLEKLQARRLLAKLGIYRKFTNALALAVIFSVIWIGYELYFKATDPFSERWQSAWIIAAFWHVLAFLLLCVICILWAPSQNATRYAYSDDIGEEFGEEDPILMTKPVTSIDTDYNHGKKDEGNDENSDVYGMSDDAAEDKRA